MRSKRRPNLTGIVYTSNREQPYAVWVQGVLWSFHRTRDEAEVMMKRLRRTVFFGKSLEELQQQVSDVQQE